MSAMTIVFPDNAAGAHNAIVVSQLVEKLGGKIVPAGVEHAKALDAATTPPPTGPAAGLGAGGMLGLRPANLRTPPPTAGPMPPGR